ncbi:MAG: hypothetical protein EBX19_07800, partial [Actinobacteria bacterium]|nr:hypothetical protein [Actinomycetota bacterium]
LANMTFTNAIALKAPGTVDTGTNRVNSTGTISGSGSLNKQGTGTLVLSGSNTFSGGSFLNAGTLSFGSTDALGSGNLTFVSNSVLQSTANLNITNRVVINSGVTGTFDYGNYTMTNSGVISGAGNFLKSGNGALSLTASNTFSGTMQINAGTVDFGTNGSVAPTTVYLGFATNDRGIMRVQNGNTLNISGSSGMLIGVSGAGALYQSGGNINLTGSASAANFVVGMNSGAYGYYQLSGGSVSIKEFAVGSYAGNATGVLDVLGGSLVTEDYFFMNRGDGTGGAGQKSMVNVIGGTLQGGPGDLPGQQARYEPGRQQQHRDPEPEPGGLAGSGPDRGGRQPWHAGAEFQRRHAERRGHRGDADLGHEPDEPLRRRYDHRHRRPEPDDFRCHRRGGGQGIGQHPGDRRRGRLHRAAPGGDQRRRRAVCHRAGDRGSGDGQADQHRGHQPGVELHQRPDDHPDRRGRDPGGPVGHGSADGQRFRRADEEGVEAGTLEFNAPAGASSDANPYIYMGGTIGIGSGATVQITGTRYDFNQDTFVFGTNGGGTLLNSSANFVNRANTFRTTGGARNQINASGGFFNFDTGTNTFDVARGSDASSDLTVNAVLANAGSILKTGNGIMT